MKQYNNDEEAQVGIGTMIVFIATILIAAVAAGVLIDTSQTLQDKSTKTGNEATRNVGTSLEVMKIFGERSATADAELDFLAIQIRSSPGAEPLDLTTLQIQFNDGTYDGFIEYVAGDQANAGEFGISEVVGTSGDSILEAGEIYELQIGEDGNDIDVGPSTTFELHFSPESGNDVSTSITTPTSFGTKLVFDLS